MSNTTMTSSSKQPISIFTWVSVAIGIITCTLAPVLMRMVNEKPTETEATFNQELSRGTA